MRQYKIGTFSQLTAVLRQGHRLRVLFSAMYVRVFEFQGLRSFSSVWGPGSRILPNGLGSGILPKCPGSKALIEVPGSLVLSKDLGSKILSEVPESATSCKVHSPMSCLRICGLGSHPKFQSPDSCLRIWAVGLTQGLGVQGQESSSRVQVQGRAQGSGVWSPAWGSIFLVCYFILTKILGRH